MFHFWIIVFTKYYQRLRRVRMMDQVSGHLVRFCQPVARFAKRLAAEK
jgi:hypothetical protein